MKISMRRALGTAGVLGLAACSSGEPLDVQLYEVATLEEANSLLQGCSGDCAALIVAWTEGMSLSVDAIGEVTAAAAAMGIPVISVPYESAREATGELADELAANGMFDHAPAVTLIKQKEAVGPAVLGYKRARAYRATFEPRLAALPSNAEWQRAATRTASTAAGSGVGVVIWEMEMERMPGYFYRWLPGSDWFSYDVADTVFLHDFDTGESLVVPGRLDFVPSPDGDLVVTPIEGRGLTFYSVLEVLRAARRGVGRDVPPVLEDALMDDQYPSVGKVHEVGDTVDYRIAVSWFRGLAMREYRAVWEDDGGVDVRPTSDKSDGCPGYELSLPIISKDGSVLAARDEQTGTMKLFSYDHSGCTELYDLGKSTTKVAFSSDGRQIAYGFMDSSSRRSHIYVYEIESGVESRVAHTESVLLMIPEFVGTNRVLVLTGDRGKRAFRLIQLASGQQGRSP